MTSLQTIWAELTILNNAKLTSIPSFSALESIQGEFTIRGNDVLTTVSGFEAFTRISGSIFIEDNTALSACCGLLPFVDGSVPPGGSKTISNNAMGCNSNDEIIADCSGGGTDDATLGLPSLANDIRIYPNPASQNLYIEGINQETSLIIRTLAGKTLLRSTLRQNQATDLASLPQGVYLLTLQSGQEQTTNRLVIGL